MVILLRCGDPKEPGERLIDGLEASFTDQWATDTSEVLAGGNGRRSGSRFIS